MGKEKVLSTDSRSVEELIQLVKDHDTRTSKYAKKRARRVMVDTHTAEVDLPQAIERLVLGGKLKVNWQQKTQGRPTVQLDSSVMYHPGAMADAEVQVSQHPWTVAVYNINSPIKDRNVAGLFVVVQRYNIVRQMYVLLATLLLQHYRLMALLTCLWSV